MLMLYGGCGERGCGHGGHVSLDQASTTLRPILVVDVVNARASRTHSSNDQSMSPQRPCCGSRWHCIEWRAGSPTCRVGAMQLRAHAGHSTRAITAGSNAPRLWQQLASYAVLTSGPTAAAGIALTATKVEVSVARRFGGWPLLSPRRLRLQVPEAPRQ